MDNVIKKRSIICSMYIVNTDHFCPKSQLKTCVLPHVRCRWGFVYKKKFSYLINPLITSEEKLLDSHHKTGYERHGVHTLIYITLTDYTSNEQHEQHATTLCNGGNFP